MVFLVFHIYLERCSHGHGDDLSPCELIEWDGRRCCFGVFRFPGRVPGGYKRKGSNEGFG